MLDRIPFGSTGHESSRVIFGAAALGGMRQERADHVLDLLLEHGVNHIDTAAGYGESELRLAPWLKRHRADFFLATKTGERSYAGARDGIRKSLERLEVDQLDLIQLHNLVDPEEWKQALAPGGAVEAAVEARDAGLVRFIGVTGHGTRVAERHLASLERFAFDSVLLPCNHSMLSMPEYAADFDALVELCRTRGVAVQTIKSIARRRWPEDHEGPRFSWYEPLRDPEAIRRAVHFVLRRPGLVLNSSSDATLLPETLAAAEARDPGSDDAAMLEDAARHGVEPLFIRDVRENV